MAQTPKLNFNKVPISELRIVLKSFAEDPNHQIIFWKYIPKYFSGKLLPINGKILTDGESLPEDSRSQGQFNSKNFLKSSIKIQYEFLPINLNNQTICLHFNSHGVEYFFKGLVQQFSEHDFSVVLDSDFFRVEKRLKDRVQIQKNSQCLLCLPFERTLLTLSDQDPNSQKSHENGNNASTDNIVPIHKKMIEKKNLEKQQALDIVLRKIDLHHNNKTKTSKATGATNDEFENTQPPMNDLIQIQVIDLNAEGVAGIILKSEFQLLYPFLLGEDPEKNLDGRLLLNGLTFEVKNLKVSYFIDYIESQQKNHLPFQPTSNTPQKSFMKIGMSFKKNSLLKKEIEESFKVSLDLLDYCHEFEDYLKNEE